jgi:hypothetical protein
MTDRRVADNRSLGELLVDLSRETATLIRQEVALARSELTTASRVWAGTRRSSAASPYWPSAICWRGAAWPRFTGISSPRAQTVER